MRWVNARQLIWLAALSGFVWETAASTAAAQRFAPPRPTTLRAARRVPAVTDGPALSSDEDDSPLDAQEKRAGDSPSAPAEEPKGETPPEKSESDDKGTADDLNKLLDIADKDPARLSSVDVQSSPKASSMAPSLNTEVSTVSRTTSTVGRSPAAVFVISNEMIRRSGARNIPDALRLAPGVNVARIDANKWAISIRGFNGRFANKLLVQIDGRTVYTPLFGGTFWDVQDVLLEDVERIEIIRGPGATVWGVNAVNGVINVITKKSSETQGAFVEAGAGTEEQGFASARYGGTLGEGLSYRIYGKWFERDQGFAPAGIAADDWRMARSGFRVDWDADDADLFTFQGDYYDGLAGSLSQYPAFVPPYSAVVHDDSPINGGNLLGRWTHKLSDDSDWSLQTYYDRTDRSFREAGFAEDRDTWDIDFQYRFKLGDFQSIVCGCGYRHTRDRVRNNGFFSFNPNRRADDLFSYFVQDEITLLEDTLYATLGAKFSHSDYTPFEFQPTARLLWTPDERHSIWSAVSRAVRSPTRADDDANLLLSPIGVLPPAGPGLPPVGIFPQILGSRNAVSEDLLATEVGMRGQPLEWFSWDAAGFYHEYDDLSSSTAGAPVVVILPSGLPALVVPTNLTNGGDGYTYGFELVGNVDVMEGWRISGGYSFLRMFLSNASGEGESPNNQLYAVSSWTLTEDVHFDMIWRYVDSLPALGVPSYNVMDLRLAWTPLDSLELAAVGRNLLDADHPEFAGDQFTGQRATNVEREVYGVMTWRY